MSFCAILDKPSLIETKLCARSSQCSYKFDISASNIFWDGLLDGWYRLLCLIKKSLMGEMIAKIKYAISVKMLVWEVSEDLCG